jgi:hypothetical protein
VTATTGGVPAVRLSPSVDGLVWITAAGLATVGLASCRDAGTSTEPVSKPCIDPPVTVRQTFDCLRAWHAAGAYQAMRPHLDPSAGEEVLDLLVALDELLAANAGAQNAVRHACPQADAARLDLSYLEQYMGLFSRDTTFLREIQKDDRTTVIAQIGDRLPLEELQFRRVHVRGQPGRWVYIPGRSVPGLVQLLRDMTRALDQITLVMSDAKEATPESVMQEYQIRVLGKLRRYAGVLANTSAGPR